MLVSSFQTLFRRKGILRHHANIHPRNFRLGYMDQQHVGFMPIKQLQTLFWSAARFRRHEGSESVLSKLRYRSNA